MEQQRLAGGAAHGCCGGHAPNHHGAHGGYTATRRRSGRATAGDSQPSFYAVAPDWAAALDPERLPPGLLATGHLL